MLYYKFPVFYALLAVEIGSGSVQSGLDEIQNHSIS